MNEELEKNLEQDFDAEVKQFEQQLKEKYGLVEKEVKHFKRPIELPFTAKQRPHTTIWISGLTMAHEHIIRGAWAGEGYKVESLDVPDNEALNFGKEYGNRGQCNPTYYTVGNLVKALVKLREAGHSTEDLEKNYIFLTAGACGPCRFGMYEAEYRKALRDAGFPNFRVILFQQGEGLSQGGEDAGLAMNPSFFIGMLKAMMIGDMINELGYKIRPYEVVKGQTNEVLESAKAYMYDVFAKKNSIIKGLRHIKKMFDNIEVDYTRVKPRVKITGEFFAMTTEGDGNYHMAEWLEEEGAEVHVEPIGTWIEYLIWTREQKAKDRSGLAGKILPILGYDQEAAKMIGILKLAQKMFRTFYDIYRGVLGFKVAVLPNQDVMARYGHMYYNTRLGGGEGHMEVGKNIMAVKHKKAHMVISLKPFGCMPSTQSDGVQSKVVADFPDAIFIPIETSGDGEVNVKSRVQMKLYEAKMKARAEFQRVLDDHGVTLEEVKEFAAKHKEYRHSMRRLPHEVISTAGNFIYDIAKKMPRKKRAPMPPAGIGAAQGRSEHASAGD
jgi:predicted nucleotide-binding protein (sugar kinase/HSP70/actin superfamily)